MSVEKLILNNHSGKITCEITPPASKSESNRVLIINALAGNAGELKNLSNARDTQTMIRLLRSDDKVLDVIDAGTTMRFLTAYLAVTGQERELTGTARMRERPIKLLVDALRNLSARIDYKEKEGFPPLLIKPFSTEQVKASHIKIKGDVSSQYITALLMIAPLLPEGMKLELEGKVGSAPYIAMTLSLMKHFGVTSDWKENIITIAPQKYKPAFYEVESDWSAASYWYSITALADEASVFLKGYKKDSFQGDRIGADIMDKLGVKTTFKTDGILLEKKSAEKNFEHDFTDCPDLAQTVAVVCAAKGITGTLKGLESLRIKETDRIAALQNELGKFGARLTELVPDREYRVESGNFSVNGQSVATYHDHRMAMAFAPLALRGKLEIEDPEVVNKSYPHYWEDLRKAGFK